MGGDLGKEAGEKYEKKKRPRNGKSVYRPKTAVEVKTYHAADRGRTGPRLKGPGKSESKTYWDTLEMGKCRQRQEKLFERKRERGKGYKENTQTVLPNPCLFSWKAFY